MRCVATVAGRTIRVEVRESGGRYLVTLDGEAVEVDVAEAGDHFASVVVGHESHEVGFERRPDGYRVHFATGALDVGLADAEPGVAPVPGARRPGPARICAPMPGRVVRVLTKPGREVLDGEGLVVVEAMKMENELRAPRAGSVVEVPVAEGQTVEAGAVLVVLG